MLSELILSRFFPKQYGQAPQRGTGLGSTACDLVAPSRFEMARAGRRFISGVSNAVTGQAPVQVLPINAAAWVLWNADNAKSYALEEIGMMLTAGTPGVGGVLLGRLFNSPVQNSVTAGIVIGSASGSAIGSKACINNTVSMAVSVPALPWFPIASNPSPNVTAFAGSTFLENRNIQGGIVLPPTWGLGLTVLAPAGTTPLFAPFFTWVEVEADLE